jgi:hypothetical protein
VAADITSAAPLFPTLLDGSSGETRRQDVSLFTYAWTGITPVVVHHNTHRKGTNVLRETWRPMLWFQERLRVPFDASGAGATSYVAAGGPDGLEY